MKGIEYYGVSSVEGPIIVEKKLKTSFTMKLSMFTIDLVKRELVEL